MEILKQGTEDNIKWTLTDDGTLTISGEGNMPDWDTDMSVAARTPWYIHNCLNSIKKVIIEPGVTSVGIGAFDRCHELVEVVLPKGITSIGNSAFRECYSLKKINIPSGCLMIGDFAFEQCRSLEFISLPDSIRTLGLEPFILSGVKRITVPPLIKSLKDFSFSLWDALEELNIPSSIEIINSVFLGESLRAINVAADNPAFTSVDGVLYNKDMTKLICYPANRPGESYRIPDTVTKIDSDAFNGCRNLINVYIPEKVSDKIAFLENYALENIFVSEKNPDFTSEDGVLFNKDKTILVQFPCNKKDEYRIPESVEKLSDYAFLSVRSLTKLHINSKISNFVVPCISPMLRSISVSKTNPYLASAGGILFNKDFTELYFYPNDKPNRYYRIPKTVENIDTSAFFECNNLEYLFIPEAAYFDDDSINFENCKNLKSISVDKLNRQYSSKDGVLYNSDRSHLIAYPQNKSDANYSAPSTLLSIGYYAFCNNKHIETVSIEKSIVQEIDKYAFCCCDKLRSFNLIGDTYLFVDGTLWDMNTHRVIWDRNNDYRKVWEIESSKKD